MEIQGVSEKVIRDAAIKINAKCERWRPTRHGFAFVLRPEHGSNVFRAKHRGRRVNAICYHGHKAFMDEVFKARPEAVIISTIARYDGEADYLRKLRIGPDARKGFVSTTSGECIHEE